MSAIAAGAIFGCSPTECSAPRLDPTYLPPASREIELDPYIPGEWRRVWEVGDRFLEITGGVASRVELVHRSSVRVRGESASVGKLEMQNEEDGAVPVVFWTESSDCGKHRYAVSSNTLSADEVVKVAQGLRS